MAEQYGAEGQQGEHSDADEAPVPALREELFPENNRQDHGQEAQREEPEIVENRGHGLPEEAPGHLRGHGEHEGKLKIGSEKDMAAVIGDDQHPGQEPTNASDPPGSFFVGEPSAQQPEESAEGGSRQGQPEKNQSGGVPGSVGEEQQPFEIHPEKGEGKPAGQGVFHFFGHGITLFP